ncbi:MAG: sialate O-acetylesterase [Maribacter sp.]|jgi:sialate O-acetylesterase
MGSSKYFCLAYYFCTLYEVRSIYAPTLLNYNGLQKQITAPKTNQSTNLIITLRMKTRTTLILTLFFLIFMNRTLFAEVTLNTIFADHMVLQRNHEIHIYGTADIGESIEVKFAGQTKSMTTTEINWSVYLSSIEAGGPYTLEVNGDNDIELNDILVGDVWICSGQSNMASKIYNYKRYGNGLYEEFEDVPGDYSNDNIRLVTLGTSNHDAIISDPVIKNSWIACNPKSALSFSATGYFFGKSLQAEIGVPIGLVLSSKGATGMGSWMATETIENNDVTKASYIDKTYNLGISKLYNSMIYPLHKMPITGVVWYQGEYETTHRLGDEFESVFKILISSWREAWGQGDFPFIFAQLSAWGKANNIPEESEHARARQGQLDVWNSVVNTGMAVTFDGGAKNIHPPNKESVGSRLALMARKVAYHEDILYTGPVIKAGLIEDAKMKITFEHYGDNLQSKEMIMDKYTAKYVLSADTLYGFTIAGSDKVFYDATAEIVGKNTLEIYSPNVSDPVYVRYAWNRFPLANLFDSDDFPASPFELSMASTLGNVEKPSINIYPNPSNGVIILDLKNLSNITNFNIFDLNGRLVEQHSLSPQQKDERYVRYESDLPPGHYTIQIIYDGVELTEKLFIY